MQKSLVRRSLVFCFLAKLLPRGFGEFPPVLSLQPRRQRPEQVEAGRGLMLLHESIGNDGAETFQLPTVVIRPHAAIGCFWGQDSAKIR